MAAPGPSTALHSELAAIVGADAVLDGDVAGYGSDAAEAAGLHGVADAVVLPGSAEEVAAIVAWCYGHDVPIVPRGGGTGFAGGAVPAGGDVVLSLERLDRVHRLDPGLWRMQVEAGVTTATVQRLARESGLYFPPDPGAAEQSQIGGNIATNAGGPHAFKHGATGAWLTGVEAVVAPGELIRVGGPVRKDVAGYDLKALLTGSEGTLGVITAAWLRLIPAPATRLPLLAFYPGSEEGAAGLDAVLSSGVVAAALEYLDAGTLRAAGGALPDGLPAGCGFLLIAEAEGDEQTARRERDELATALRPGSLELRAPDSRSRVEALWRWRDGVSLAVTALRGGKLSEDIAVPVDRLAEAIAGVLAIGEQHELESCSWGHAGDGNLHATFILDPRDRQQARHAGEAAAELFALAARLGGTVSGEHGLGLLKSGELARQWDEGALRLHEEVKRVFDPKGLLNPGKKLARPRDASVG